MNNQPSHLPAKQQGAVLAIGLILLLVLSLVGVTNMNKVTTAENLAGNERDANLAFQAAEAALLEGEHKISILPAGTAPNPVGNCSGIACKTAILDKRDEIWKDPNWDAKSRVLSDDNIAGNDYGVGILAAAPTYMIEFLANDEEDASNPIQLYYYRITARAKGSTPESEVILQSVYRRPF